MEVIHQSPERSQYTALSEHQSQTPSSFFSGPPVLHYHGSNLRLLITEDDLQSSPAFSKIANAPGANGVTSNGDSNSHIQDISLEGVDVWITSEKFILYRPALSIGVAVPYPSISLHAIQRLQLPEPSATSAETRGLYVQISSSSGFDDHNPEEMLSFTLIPLTPDTGAGNAGTDLSNELGDSSISTEPPVTQLFAALSACANLHPDPMSPSSSNPDLDIDIAGADTASTSVQYEVLDGLPPPVPGSGGWITAENVNDFFDEEGNWRAGGLGPGAGVVRPREDDQAASEFQDEGQTDEALKWRRTD